MNKLVYTMPTSRYELRGLLMVLGCRCPACLRSMTQCLTSGTSVASYDRAGSRHKKPLHLLTCGPPFISALRRISAYSVVCSFFLYFAPLSAIDISQFRRHADHTALVYDEPVLCCALLVISSRAFILPGAGATTRSHNIHQRLWQYYELLLKRVVLGQEKHSSAKTRTLGTIESFLLLSDWHPRAIHLPPETEGWDAFLISPAYDRVNRRRQGDEASMIRWREDVFEPVKRGDRMSWMLLGLATNLGCELGVLEKHTDEACHSAVYQQRRIRAGKLLTLYVTQTAVRLGYPDLLLNVPAILQNANGLGNESSPESQGWQIYTNLWRELVQLAKAARAAFFCPSAKGNSKVLENQYMVLLEHFESSLTKWHLEFVTQSECKFDQLHERLERD